MRAAPETLPISAGSCRQNLPQKGLANPIRNDITSQRSSASVEPSPQPDASVRDNCTASDPSNGQLRFSKAETIYESDPLPGVWRVWTMSEPPTMYSEHILPKPKGRSSSVSSREQKRPSEARESSPSEPKRLFQTPHKRGNEDKQGEDKPGSHLTLRLPVDSRHPMQYSTSLQKRLGRAFLSCRLNTSGIAQTVLHCLDNHFQLQGHVPVLACLRARQLSLSFCVV